MKKILTILAVLFVVNCSAQDTTYFQKRNDLYMSIRTKVNDSTMYNRYYSMEIKKRNHRNKVYTFIVGTVFSSLTVWFFWGYHKYS